MITREEAMRNGLKKYTDCKPCFKDHPPARYTKTGKCVYCHRQKSSKNRMSRHTKNIIKHRYGLVRVTSWVHLEDLDTHAAFCEALRLDRGIPVDLEE